MNVKTLSVFLFFSLFLMGASGESQDGDEREALRALQQSLRARTLTLTGERDFLLFQKAMYAVDSKYLLLNVTAKTGQLKHKNRVLKDFRFTLSRNFPGDTFRTGMSALAKKTEGKSGRHALIFGDALILQWKRATVPPREAGIPFISLKKRDMQSIFHAVEPGARAYVVR